jgi:prefoldin subunit 5
MIEERIQRTESAIKTAENISADEKAKLLDLLAKLKSALGKVSQTHHEDAQSITRFAEASAHEATRTKKKPKLLNAALHGLKQSVEEFEASHPELVTTVNQFATLLAEMGL